MLKIRLARKGSRGDAFYRIVVSESASTPNSRNVDTLGTYDPGTNPATVRLDVARAEEWIRKGAHASETVRSLIVRAKGVAST